MNNNNQNAPITMIEWGLIAGAVVVLVGSVWMWLDADPRTTPGAENSYQKAATW